jgi:hypothetical protein
MYDWDGAHFIVSDRGDLDGRSPPSRTVVMAVLYLHMLLRHGLSEVISDVSGVSVRFCRYSCIICVTDLPSHKKLCCNWILPLKISAILLLILVSYVYYCFY